MNTCYNAVDRHVEQGYGNQVAIIHDSPVTKRIHMISFRQLQQQVHCLLAYCNACWYTHWKNKIVALIKCLEVQELVASN